MLNGFLPALLVSRAQKYTKYNFTVTTLTKVLVTLWTKDDLIFIPERYRLQVYFHFTGLLLDRRQAEYLLYKRFLLWGEFPGRPVAGRSTNFAGRCPGITKSARSSLEAHLSDRPAVDEEQP
jgi:hypothetical protein